jgi:hypothetical protein
MAYKRSQAKGNSAAGSELFGYPGTLAIGDDRPVGGDGVVGDTDPFYTSDNIKYIKLTEASGQATGTVSAFHGNALNGSVRVVAVQTATPSAKAIAGVIRFVSDAGVYEADTYTASVSGITGFAAGTNEVTVTINGTTGVASFAFDVKVVSDYDYYAALEYNQESATNIPELEMQILQYIVTLTRRQLRGKFSLDAAVDAKAYHGISLENELMEMMKLQLTNEINREIISDLRLMGNKIYRDLTYGANNTTGNYDDTHKLILDAINGLSAEIYNQTRVGRGNFVVGNPVTLSFLDRVPGFVGSGVDMTSGGLSYAGKQGGRIAFYFDPQYPKNELLIGYKGASALDCGYIHAPYLPITATPTLYNQETGDPSKIFYTRYGKSFRDYDNNTGKPFNAIYRGEYFYAKLFLNSFPTLGGVGIA